MTWLQENGFALILGLSFLGAACGVVGHALPAGIPQRVLLGFAGILPGNLTGAWKGISGQIAPPTPGDPT